MNGSIFPNLSQNWLKSNKIYEKLGDFAQYLAQNWFDWYMNGSLFLEKLLFVWVYFQFRCITSLPKPNLSTPPRVEHPQNLSISKFADTLRTLC